MKRLAALFWCFVFWLVVATTTVAAEPEIRLIEKDKVPVGIEVAGLPAELVADLAKLPADDRLWALTLSVYVGETSAPGQPAIGGTYALEVATLRFTPRFSLKGGLAYRAEVCLPAADRRSAPARYEKVFVLPAPPRGKPAEVTAIYPSADTLPENQLRFYLHFSAPMSGGDAYSHLQLLGENGAAVELPFLELGEELWDARSRRLTLLIDPGRIKRGLVPREELGPVLEAGKKYTLVVGQTWPDASGQRLPVEYKKTFSVGPPIEAALDPQDWKISSPAAGSTDLLEIVFPRPLDRALVQRTIAVVGPDDKPVAGNVTLALDERAWRFQPDRPWNQGKHQLAIDTTLEDLAGNRIGRPFEVDQFSRIDKQVLPETVRLPFIIQAH
ncbi:MAG: Ig-like domain-containing protein [Pirellulaceae bacterium]